jgi:DNA-binding transcriptional ArsR family regulator
MDETRSLTTLEEIKAMNDPYRLQIFFYFQRMGRPATVKEIADNMGEVPAKVHYHVKKLESAGILRLAYTKNVNGIIAKYYELTARDFNIRVNNLAPDVSKKVVDHNIKLTMMAAYDNSKKIIIEQIEEGCNPMLSINTLHLTDEKVKELRKILSDFIKSNKDNKDEEGAKEYHFFNVLGPIKSIKK